MKFASKLRIEVTVNGKLDCAYLVDYARFCADYQAGIFALHEELAGLVQTDPGAYGKRSVELFRSYVLGAEDENGKPMVVDAGVDWMSLVPMAQISRVVQQLVREVIGDADPPVRRGSEAPLSGAGQAPGSAPAPETPTAPKSGLTAATAANTDTTEPPTLTLLE